MTDTEFLKSPPMYALDLVEMLSLAYIDPSSLRGASGGLEWTLFSPFLIVIFNGTCGMYGISTQHVRGRDH